MTPMRRLQYQITQEAGQRRRRMTALLAALADQYAGTAA
jgi:hypothetical protein